MSTIEATLSLIKNLNKEDQQKVLLYIQDLISSDSKNPFSPLTVDKILSDLSISEEEFNTGKSLNAEDAIQNLRRKYVRICRILQ